MTVILVLLIVGLLGVLGVGVWWHRRSQQRWRAQLMGASAELTQAEQRQSTAIAEVQEAHDRAIAEQRDRYSEIRKRLQLSAGERTSRANILAVCIEFGMDAVVLSNVLFRPVDAFDERVYHAQVDHLLVTDKALLIVESKYWKYAVFDGVDFRSQSPVLRVLFGDLVEDYNPRQAVRIAPDRDGDRIQLSISNPARQARRQAQRLSAYLTARGTPSPWINTCVYYCHPRGVINHSDFNERTSIVSTSRTLGDTIMYSQTGRKAANNRVNVDAIVEALAPLSTDVTGTGAYSQRWPSILDAHSETEHTIATSF